jgi:hypothetical protein
MPFYVHGTNYSHLQSRAFPTPAARSTVPTWVRDHMQLIGRTVRPRASLPSEPWRNFSYWLDPQEYARKASFLPSIRRHARPGTPFLLEDVNTGEQVAAFK